MPEIFLHHVGGYAAITPPLHLWSGGINVVQRSPWSSSGDSAPLGCGASMPVNIVKPDEMLEISAENERDEALNNNRRGILISSRYGELLSWCRRPQSLIRAL